MWLALSTLGELSSEALKVGGRDMFTLWVRDRFMEELLRAEELLECAPDDAGEAGPTLGEAPKVTPEEAALLEGSGGGGGGGCG